MRSNLDGFGMVPSTESIDRRLASLPRVLRAKFPCFDGTIKALRLPAVRPAALRCLRLAVPQAPLVVSLPFAPASEHEGPGVGFPVAPAGIVLRRRQDLPSSWGTPIVRLRMFFDPGRTACARPVAAQQRGPRSANDEGSHDNYSFEAQ
jgi:hypothetical protein